MWLSLFGERDARSRVEVAGGAAIGWPAPADVLALEAEGLAVVRAAVAAGLAGTANQTGLSSTLPPLAM